MKTLNTTAKVLDLIDDYSLAGSGKATNTKVYQRCFISKYLRTQGMCLQDIGILFKKHHSTVIHYLKTYDDMIATNNKDFEMAVYPIAIELNKEYIFDEPIIKDIHNALLTNDCGELKKIALLVFKSITGIDHKKKIKDLNKIHNINK